MDIFRFAHPNFLYLLLVIPIIAALMIYFARKRKKAIETFGDETLLNHLMPAFSSRRSRVKSTLLLIAFILQVFVMAGPQFGAKIETMKRKGIEIMVALDVSNSMNAMDVQPSRLDFRDTTKRPCLYWQRLMEQSVELEKFHNADREQQRHN